MFSQSSLGLKQALSISNKQILCFTRMMLIKNRSIPKSTLSLGKGESHKGIEEDTRTEHGNGCCFGCLKISYCVVLLCGNMDVILCTTPSVQAEQRVELLQAVKSFLVKKKVLSFKL